MSITSIKVRGEGVGEFLSLLAKFFAEVVVIAPAISGRDNYRRHYVYVLRVHLACLP